MTAIDKRKLTKISEDLATDVAWRTTAPEHDGVLLLGGQKWYFVTQDGASLLLHRPESSARVRITITAEEY